MNDKLKETFIRIVRSKAFIIVAILIALYTIAGFVLMPFLIERYLPQTLSQRLDCEVSLEQVKINPYTLSLEATAFQINEPDGIAIAGFQRLYVNFQISSLFRWALTFAEISVDAPSVNILIEKNGEVNLTRLAGEKKAASDEKKSKPLRLLLHDAGINRARIDITDNRQPKPASVSFSPLDIRLSGISTLPDRVGQYTLTTSADGATLKGSGQVSLQPLRSQGSLAFQQISLITPWHFVCSLLNIAPPEGKLNIETQYLLDLSKDNPVFALNDLSVKSDNLKLQRKGAEKPFLSLLEISVDAEKVDLVQHRIDPVSLAIRGGTLNLIKDRDGVLSIHRLTSRKTETRPVSSPSSSTKDKGNPWAINIADFDLQKLAINFTDHSKAKPTRFSADEVRLAFNAAINVGSTEAQLKVDDLGLSLKQIAMEFLTASQPAVEIEAMTLADGSFDLGTKSASISRLELSNGMVNVIRDKDNKINLAQLLVSKDSEQVAPEKAPKEKDSNGWQYLVEKASLSGFKTKIFDLTVKPGSTLIDLDNINLTVSRFDGTSPSPFEISLKVVQGGEFSVSGKLDPVSFEIKSDVTVTDFSLPVAQPYLAKAAADLTLKSGLLSTAGTFNRNSKGGTTYKGRIGFSHLKIIENSSTATLMGWEQLETPDLFFSLKPNEIKMDILKLAGLEGKFIIYKDKTVNLVEAFSDKDRASAEIKPKESSPKSEGQPFSVRVGRLSLDRGKLDFADLSLRPQFASKIHELKGTVIGISSSPGALTQVDLQGRVDEYGSSNIKGEINSFNPKEHTDISVIFSNVDMSNLTPYSGKFAGRKIDSGKLSLDLQYKIENSQLLSQNKIVIDTLKLGEKVESPDAMNLPLDLAIALLRDSNGVIDMDLPITGSLEDPEFRYGPLVWKALVNLLTKIVTAPFKALGGLLGGEEEELDAIIFEAGRHEVPPPEQEKLVKLLDALSKRPNLKLIVTGRYNSDSDGEAIKRIKVRRAVAEATGVHLAPGEDPGPVDFSNPQSLEKLAEILVERYGQEAYEALKPEKEPEDEKIKSKQVKKNADTTQVSENPAKLAKQLFADLVKREQVERSTLKQLADNRAQAIVRMMTTGTEGLPTERLMVKPSEGTTDESISVALDLDAMR